MTDQPGEKKDNKHKEDHFIADASNSCNYTGASKSSDGRPVQIFRVGQNGESNFVDKKQLELVFGQESVAKQPVAIYSIAGAFRKGKSFMLNFFHRFLKAAAEDKSDSWLQNKSEELSGGFEWRGGTSAHTQGIWIWSEPFFIETAAHGKVAVFLMDTQGAFDHETSVQGCSVIFALSTLISSVQIFNIMQQIQEDNLQNLQLFTSYGKLVRQHTRQIDRNGSSKKEKPFQGLLFLVRDWSDPDVEFGFEGGSEVLSNVLKVQLRHKDLESVRENIAECFESVKCFLMPHPGQKIAVRGAKASPPLLQDVDEMFLTWIDNLVQETFSPDNVVVKKYNENAVTGNELSIFISECCKMFESGQIPPIGTIFEAMAKANIQKMIKEGTETYTKSMEQKSGGVYVEPNVLADLHQQSKVEVLSWYDAQPKPGEQKLIAKYQKKFEERLDHRFVLLEQRNRTKQEQMKSEILEHVMNAVNDFEADLEKFTNGVYVEQKALADKVRESRVNADKKFKVHTEKYKHTVVSKYKKQLDKRLTQASKLSEETNHHKQAILIEQLAELATEALQHYCTTMDKLCKDKCLEENDFRRLNGIANISAINIFGASDIGKETTHREKQSDVLKDNIKREENRFNETNELYKKIKAGNVLETTYEAKQCYYTKMENVCGDGYIDPDGLERAHDDAKREVENMFGDQLGTTSRSLLNESLDKHYQKLKAKNERFKQKMRNSFDRKKNELVKNYKELMDLITETCLEATKITQLHQKLRSEELDKYNEIREMPIQDFDEIKQQLETDVDAYYNLICTKNDQKRRDLDDRAENLLEELKNDYVTAMNERCGGECVYVKPRILTQFHEMNLELVENKARSVLSPIVCTDEYVNRLRSEINALRTTIERNNERTCLIL